MGRRIDSAIARSGGEQFTCSVFHSALGLADAAGKRGGCSSGPLTLLGAPVSLQKNTFRTILTAVTFLLCVSALASSSASDRQRCQRLTGIPASSFADPKACVFGDPTHVIVGTGVYVAPFSVFTPGEHVIVVGDSSNVQDSVIVDATQGDVTLGAEVILAHGATVTGPAKVGADGTCPQHGATHCPSFVGFNAVVDQANVQMDAMVLHLAKVSDGRTLSSGQLVFQGKWVTPSQGGASRIGKVAGPERAFMNEVVEVNEAFATQYPVLESQEGDQSIRGISLNPETEFNPLSVLPTLAGVSTRDPEFRNRIIGPVVMDNSLEQLGPETGVMGNHDSLRADEGFPFMIGFIKEMCDNFTIHSLQNKADGRSNPVTLGAHGIYGLHSIVHGGGFINTETGENFALGERGVFYKSIMTGCGSSVGRYSLVEGSTFDTPKNVGDCWIVLNCPGENCIQYVNENCPLESTNPRNG